MASKVALLYGVLTGPRVSLQFKKELERQGYAVVTDPGAADILVCHSGGCFLLPEVHNKQSLILINPVYWPGKTGKQRSIARAKSHLQFWKHNYTLKQWLWRTFWGGYYALAWPRHHIRMTKLVAKYDLGAQLPNNPTVIIRNNQDDWLTPEVDKLTSTYKNLQIIRLPGDHDDCWVRPEAYVAALKSLR